MDVGGCGDDIGDVAGDPQAARAGRRGQCDAVAGRVPFGARARLLGAGLVGWPGLEQPRIVACCQFFDRGRQEAGQLACRLVCGYQRPVFVARADSAGLDAVSVGKDSGLGPLGCAEAHGQEVSDQGEVLVDASGHIFWPSGAQEHHLLVPRPVRSKAVWACCVPKPRMSQGSRREPFVKLARASRPSGCTGGGATWADRRGRAGSIAKLPRC